MPRRNPSPWLLALPLLLVLYLTGLTSAGLLGPDEPRYASIGRQMAISGDWITPRLWGAPWFEKPALLYWLTGIAFRLGLPAGLAPRLPIALVSIAFLIFFQRVLNRSFGATAAWSATLMLATSAAWLGCSFIGTTDLLMAAAFSTAMFLSLDWLAAGDRRNLPLAAAFLGAAALAKGLVPLILTLPLLWCGRRRWRDLLRLPVLAPFFLVSAPWYLLCYLRNGAIFPRTFFWEQHFGRFVSTALAHGQPFWFYIPVLIAALLPWTPALALLFRRDAYRDPRRRFLLLWFVFALVFFSLAKNKLPGYLLPAIPAAAALTGIAFAGSPRTRWVLPVAAIGLISIPAALPLLPQALAEGISRAPFPAISWTWLIPVAIAPILYLLERRGHRTAALACMAIAAVSGMTALKIAALPVIDRAYSARPLWNEISGQSDRVCIAQMHRSWRYGLNYYSVTPLPDCAAAPRPIQVVQSDGSPPHLQPAPIAP